MKELKELIEFSRTLKILYVEDNYEARMQTTRMLENIFDDITIAVDGKDGLDKFDSKKFTNPFDLIITDINMPKINGIDLLKEIKKEDENISCIILSAHSEVDYFLDSINLGVDGYILKPINLENFLNIIKKVLNKLYVEKELQKSLKVKSEFLANMSHEIRTPLNAMLGFITFLQEKNFDEESSEYLTIVEKSGKDLLSIINDILDFSKIEARQFAIEKIEFNPKEEISNLQELFVTKASEKNILLVGNYENIKYNIISDPTRIKQVISNLLSNAIKFTHNNKKIELNVKYNDEKEELFVEVKDEGIGISEEKIDKVFKAFSQADSSTTREYGGTGLGLTISHKIIELLGSELKLESEVGSGSRFYFTILAPKCDKTEEDSEKREKTKVSSISFKGTILVVEDNKSNQMFMKIVLNKMGLVFDIASDGIEAVELYKHNHNRYDMILMDENMPNMNGIEATKKILELEKEKNLEHTPIVALTANALKGDKERFIDAKMDDYLTKPLEKEKLVKVLDKVFMRV